jgi:signal transduction histidine kinase
VRNLHNAASVAFDVLKSGRVGVTGATGAVLERSLARLGSLVDRSLAEVRLEVGNFGRTRIELSALLAEIELIGSLTARTKGVTFSVAIPTVAGLAVHGDSQILSAIIFNLAQNAIKFTRAGGRIALSVRATADRVQIDVADECGGLPAGKAAALFRPFEQRDKDRSGVGLGLVIARRGAEAHGGAISVRDIPGTGCVFTLELPRAK